MNNIDFSKDPQDPSNGFYIDNELHYWEKILGKNQPDFPAGRKTSQKPETSGPKNRIVPDKNTPVYRVQSLKPKEKYNDFDLAKEIHRVIGEDYFLAEVARNIHVIVDKGLVTLRGSVFSEEEKILVSNKAEALAGAGKVRNLLEVMEDME